MNSKTSPIESARRTIEIEKRAIEALSTRIGDEFEEAGIMHFKMYFRPNK